MKNNFDGLTSFDDSDVKAMENQEQQRGIEAIKSFGAFSEDSKVVVALSAGRDSVCLLHMMTKIVCPSNILAVHVHHHMRDDGTAEEDMEHARKVSQMMGVSFECLHLPTKENATYDWARLERRKVIRKAADRWDGENTPILVAHSLTDQAETVLMRAMTSPGIASLRGMNDFEPDNKIYRPLFWAKFHRTDCTAYCKAVHMEYRDDPSNSKSKRGKIRNLLFELCQVDHRTVSSLLNTAEQSKQDEEALQSWARKLVDDSSLGLFQQSLQEVPLAVAKRAVRIYAEAATGVSCPKAAARVEEILSMQKHKQLQIGNNAAFFLDKKGMLRVEKIKNSKNS